MDKLCSCFLFLKTSEPAACECTMLSQASSCSSDQWSCRKPLISYLFDCGGAAPSVLTMLWLLHVCLRVIII